MRTKCFRAAAIVATLVGLYGDVPEAAAVLETSFVDIDGDGVNDLKLESSWWKNRWEWAGHKQSWVTNLTGVDIDFDWPVGGQSGTVKAGKRVCADWTSWTMVFLATGEIAAKKGVNNKKQKTSAYNCVSDVAKDWKASTSSFGFSESIPGSDAPTSSLSTSYLVDDVLTLRVTADFEDAKGVFHYTYTLENFSNSLIEVNWRAARNFSHPTGIATAIAPETALIFDYFASSPPDFYGCFMDIWDADGNDLTIDAAAWVPTDELDTLIGENSTNSLYEIQYTVEDFESYADDASLAAVWSPVGAAVSLQLEIENDPNDAASNVNNEPPSVGLGTGVIAFDGMKSVRLELQPGTGGISASMLALGSSDGVVIWAEIPNGDTEVSMKINGISSERTFPVGGTLVPIELPQVGGFIGFHFTQDDFPGWDGSAMSALTVQFTSGTGQIVYIDEIVSIEPNIVGGFDIPTVSEWGLIVMTVLVLTAGTVVFGRRRRPMAA